MHRHRKNYFYRSYCIVIRPTLNESIAHREHEWKEDSFLIFPSVRSLYPDVDGKDHAPDRDHL